jgi:HEAT repeat protein
MAPPTSIAAELRESIGPQIVDLLKHDNWVVRAAGVEALSKLSEQGMFHIWSSMAPPTSIAAELRESIGPQIVDLLKHDNWVARVASAEAFSKLSEQGLPHFWSGMRLR